MYFSLLIQIAQSTLEIHYNLHKYFTYIVFCAVRRNCSCLFLDPKQACSILLSIIRKLDSQTENKNRRRSSQLPKSFQGIRWGTWPQFLSLAISKMEIKLSISLLPYLSTWNTVIITAQYSTSIFEYQHYFNRLPRCFSGKESACNTETKFPGWGRSPGVGNCNPL